MDYYRLRDIDIKGSVGERVGVVFMVTEAEVRNQRNSDKEYIRLIMVDKNCKREATVFNATDMLKNKVVNGAVLAADVDVKTYKAGKDGISCIIANIYTTEYNPLDFADWVENIEIYRGIIEKYMCSIKNVKYRELTSRVISKHWEKFNIYPAGKGMHHTEFGGLLMHTASVTDLAYRMGIKYNEVYGEDFVDLDLVATTGLLHDVMKTKEFSVDVETFGVEYSKESVLTTHLLDIATEVRDLARELGYSDDDEDIRALIHCLVSHHGKLEWGSPIEPRVIEAYLVHKADGIDSEVWGFNKNLSGLKGGEYAKIWNAGGLRVYYKRNKESNEEEQE